MDREQAMNFQVQIDNIDREMSVINRLARAYMNATPEQRANVNEGDMRAQIERYKELKNQKAVLQEQRAQAELLAARQAAEAEAARQAQLNTRGTGRRAPNNNNNNNNNNNPEGTGTQFNANSSYVALPEVRNRIVNNLISQGKYIGDDGLFHNQDGSLFTTHNGLAYVTNDGTIAGINSLNNTTQGVNEQIITPVEPITVSIDGTPITTGGQANNNGYFTGPITGRQFRRPVTIGGQVVWSPYPTNGNSIIPGYVNNSRLGIVNGPIGESILSGSNISEVDIGDNYTPAPINIAPTNEQFRISQVIGGHTYEYGDNGSVKIDGVLQRAGNGTDYIITQPSVNTGAVNTGNLSILTGGNGTGHISNPLFIGGYQR